MLRLLYMLARHLDLLGEHALGYAELIRAECGVYLRSWGWRALAFTLAALFVLIGLLSTTVVLTLWSNGIGVASWRAWTVPIVCLVFALAGIAFGLWRRPQPMSDVLAQQLQRDLDLLREASGRTETDEGEP